MIPSHSRVAVADVAELTELIRRAGRESTPLYPVGGGTSLGFGLPPKQPGWEVDLTGLSQVVDYPAADMTITVGAGIRMSELQAVLRQQQQQLPLDVPQAKQATLGGVLATNFSGPRRLGYGTARDYVIGIRAVDGHGTPFAGGGRVVKNVAGYDFCKLLIGSLGTLGVITEVTLKLKPLASHIGAIVAAPRDVAQLDRMLTQLTMSPVQPTAAEWLVGPAWQALAAQQEWPSAPASLGWLVLYLEGFEAELEWMSAQLQREWSQEAGLTTRSLSVSATERLLQELTEFPAEGDAPLTLKATVLPSRVSEFVRSIQAIDPQASLQVHAVTGVVRAKLTDYPAIGVGRAMTGTWQPLASRLGGNLVMLANRDGVEQTVRTVWGTPSGPVDLMRRIKQQFDPQGILNPGRFVY